MNDWWIEVLVDSPRTLSAVHAQVNGGSWTPLPKTTWNTWAESFNVPAGSNVVFRATATDGATATSGSYQWLQGSSPQPAPTPAPATPGAFALSASSYTVAQTAGSLTISVNRSGGSSGAVSVNYATVNGSASSGNEYTAKTGTLNWASGDTAAKSISVAIKNTTPFTGTRNFTIQLSGAAGGATMGSPNSASVTINGSKTTTTTTTTTTYAKPYIQSFSPTSGPVGTVVTINGSGFNGSNEAWVGSIHGVGVTVVSNTQVKVTIPAGAKTGSIGIFNPAGVSFTPRSFTVK